MKIIVDRTRTVNYIYLASVSSFKVNGIVVEGIKAVKYIYLASASSFKVNGNDAEIDKFEHSCYSYITIGKYFRIESTESPCYVYDRLRCKLHRLVNENSVKWLYCGIQPGVEDICVEIYVKCIECAHEIMELEINNQKLKEINNV